MRPEDLFAAIGGVESSRLEQSEFTANQSSRVKNVEEKPMYAKNRNHLFPKILAAALIAVMLATTVFAAVGYLLFDNPKQMLDALFGNNTGYDDAAWSVPDYKGDIAAEYHSDRVPLEEGSAEALASHIRSVNQSVSYAGHTLTVDTNVYDSVTKCGFLTYTIEKTDGIRPYAVAPNGEVFFPYGELMKSNQYGRSYIIREKCTDTTLCATYYYRIMNPAASDLELRLTFWAAIDDPQGYMDSPEKEMPLEIQDSPNAVTIPMDADTGLQTLTLGGGTVTLSPFSIMVNLPLLTDEPGAFVEDMKITFQNGEEYIVTDENTVNYQFRVIDSSDVESCFMLNRIVNPQNIAAVTVNAVRFEKQAE